MNIEKIKQLSRLLNEEGLSVLEVTENDLKIRLERPVPQARGPEPVQPALFPSVAPPAQPEGTVDFNNVTEIRSPMVGVFYTASAPESEPFVSVGSRVKKGDVVCIIEAMKLMNEIAADEGGEVVDVCVENGQVVEFGQVLFKLYR